MGFSQSIGATWCNTFPFSDGVYSGLKQFPGPSASLEAHGFSPIWRIAKRCAPGHPMWGCWAMAAMACLKLSMDPQSWLSFDSLQSIQEMILNQSRFIHSLFIATLIIFSDNIQMRTGQKTWTYHPTGFAVEANDWSVPILGHVHLRKQTPSWLFHGKPLSRSHTLG